MEKFIPFKNEAGQIEDPEIARRMANDEKMLRESGCNDQETTDNTIETWGKTYHAEKMTPVIVEKIRSLLSKEEIEVIRKISNDPFGEMQVKFLEQLCEDK